MHPLRLREQGLAMLNEGVSVTETSRRLGIPRSTVSYWRHRPARSPRADCPLCESVPLDTRAYAALLGFYLGDGHVALGPRYDNLRIACDLTYPGIIADVSRLMRRVRPNGNVCLVSRPGCAHVQSQWKHWHCLFPQHGPGRKHERPIVLADWQNEIVVREAAAFLRGLFHSDGCRVVNWTQREVAGEKKRYHYPRWQFTNHSDDIRGLCTWALDLLGIAWRQSNWKTISVSRRADVARLDALIGLKR